MTTVCNSRDEIVYILHDLLHVLERIIRLCLLLLVTCLRLQDFVLRKDTPAARLHFSPCCPYITAAIFLHTVYWGRLETVRPGR